MSLVLGCCREIISTGPNIIGFHKGGATTPTPTSTVEKQNNHLSCFSVDPTDLSSSSSSSDKSSIGGGESDDDDDDEFTTSLNVSQSKFSMESLEESLPIKRGLSNFFSGRSKSFANLSEATTVRSLAKTENPFNKRRRTLMACKMLRRSNTRKTFYTSSSSSIISPVSMPLLKLNEEDEENQTETDDEEKMKNNNTKEEEEEEEEVELVDISSYQHQHHHGHGRIKRFKAPRCFSLTDLHHHQ